MIKQFTTGLLVLGLVAIFWSVADAGCAKIGGKQICASWITGSEVCKVKTSGLTSVDTCGANCPVLTCSVFGTVDPGNSSCDSNQLDADCGIQGTAYCVGEDPHPATFFGVISESTDLFFNDDDLTSAAVTGKECNEKGKCKATLELDPASCPGCCTNPDNFITFTATVFNAEAKVCPGAYDINTQCCADEARNFDDTCVNLNQGSNGPGTEISVVRRCTLNKNGKKYTCKIIKS